MQRMAFSDLQRIETRIVEGRRQLITLVTQFQLPPEVADKIPLKTRERIEGILGMTYYLEPQIGDCLEWRGHLWEVTGRLIRPNKYRGHGNRVLPVIGTRYIGPCPEDSL